MKKALALAVVLLSTTSLFAQVQVKPTSKGIIGEAVEGIEGNYGMAGCGLGSVLFGKSNSVGTQILASTTNGTYANNTFGMTSGTSNCAPESTKSAATADIKKNLSLFVEGNRQQLETDVAKNSGETIVAINQILKCKDGASVGGQLQKEYNVIFKSNKNSDVAENIYSSLSNNSFAKSNCNI